MIIDWENIDVEFETVEKHQWNISSDKEEIVKPQNNNQLWLISRGRNKINMRQGEVTLKKGAVVWLKPNFSYQIKKSKSSPLCFYSIHFNLNKNGKQLSQEYPLPSEAITNTDFKYLKMLFEELFVSSNERQKDNSKLKAFHTERCKTLTKVILMEIDEISSSQDQQYIYNHTYNTDRDYLASVVYKIQHDPTYHPFIQELAEEAYMTPNAFCQAFKRRFGTTPLQYAISFRIIHASRLLVETAMNIKDIASLLGYTDPQSFGRQFLKHMKKTPTQFRNENIPKK